MSENTKECRHCGCRAFRVLLAVTLTVATCAVPVAIQYLYVMGPRWLLAPLGSSESGGCLIISGVMIAMALLAGSVVAWVTVDA